MASIIPLFELVSLGSGLTTALKDDWFDITSYGPNVNTPMPSGRQVWLGFGTLISPDKPLTFEIRRNLPTKSAATPGDTELLAFATVPSGDSKDLDMYFGGAINTLAPSVASTGVEKVWLRVKSGGAAVGGFDFIFYYTLA